MDYDATREGRSWERKTTSCYLQAPSDAWIACWVALGEKRDDVEACSLINKMIRNGREEDVTVKGNRFGNLLQHQAAMGDCCKSLEVIMALPTANIDKMNKGGMLGGSTALHWVRLANSSIISPLFGMSCSSTFWGTAELSLRPIKAATAGNANATRCLVRLGADTAVVDNYSHTALAVALARGNGDIADILDPTGEAIEFETGMSFDGNRISCVDVAARSHRRAFQAVNSKK